jgi:hydrogenase maturation protein HypF
MAGEGRFIEVRGTVQGVGFRPFIYQLALRHGVRGRVRNGSSGVTIEAFGPADVLRAFIDAIPREAPPAARVTEVIATVLPDEEVAGFAIAESERDSERRISIPADLATCPDCLAEVFDESDRRYLYPFTNCTNCGPRYSIARDVPYDRAQTTMSAFEMCEACSGEYHDPADRRFHAQPNACPACGPIVSAVMPDGREVFTQVPLRFAARALGAQLTVAVKGIGGFHLACDATSSTAVQRLRDRKRRDAKPLAVMVRDLEDARRLADITSEEASLLCSAERPIVLVPRRGDAKLAQAVAGDNPLLGLFLAYTPLHHILLREAGVPLVMTSGNVSDEPMAHENADALEQLRGIADVFLMHNRRIETRVDDSVARVINDSPVILRRARGLVPRGVTMRRPFAEPVLACGAHLKSAICIGSGDTAFLGPHIGDLETVATLRAYEASVVQMKRFIGVEPRVVAHDLHPEYFSTRYALAQPDVQLIGVQHHHAHIASVVAEHGLSSPVIGFAYDGTGYGLDDTLWGGEVLIADETSFRRVATFRPIALAGGDQAVRQVWRTALALLDDAFDGAPPLDELPLFGVTPPRGIESVRRMIERNFNAPRARGVGRLFDAMGAIGLTRPESRYEGEVAFLWNVIADPDESGCYPIVVRDGAEPWEIDARPMVQAAVRDLIDGCSPATVSARFHNTLARTTVEVARAVIASFGDMPVVLSGGCFQNARLTESILAGLRGTPVFTNREIPPGDGGVALGQAVIAAATIQRNGPASSSVPFTTEIPVCV